MHSLLKLVAAVSLDLLVWSTCIFAAATAIDRIVDKWTSKGRTEKTSSIIRHHGKPDQS